MRVVAAPLTLYQLIPELEYLITLREREPRHARGFMVRDPATGMDRRNRLGRPKKNASLKHHFQSAR